LLVNGIKPGNKCVVLSFCGVCGFFTVEATPAVCVSARAG